MPLSKVSLIPDYQNEYFFGCTFPKEKCDQLKDLFPGITDDTLVALATQLGRYRVTGFDNEPEYEESHKPDDGKTGQELRKIQSATETLNSLIHGANQRTEYLLEQAYFLYHKTSDGITHRGCPTLDDVRLVIGWLGESIKTSDDISDLLRTGRGRRPGGGVNDVPFALLDGMNKIISQGNEPISQAQALKLAKILGLSITEHYIKTWRKVARSTMDS